MRYYHRTKLFCRSSKGSGRVEAPKTPAEKFVEKAQENLDLSRKSVDDAASVSGTLWFSYLFALFYIGIAAGGVTHKDLLLENPVRLPFLNIELPLVAFFFLAPILFVISHGYTLMQFVLLAGKVGDFNSKLSEKISGTEDARRQLPSNIFVQILAGPRDIRKGGLGFLLKSVAWISLVIGPILLLLLIQIQFLPYHLEWVTWVQRFALLADVALLWALWPAVLEGRSAITCPKLWRHPFLVPASVAPIAFAFIVARFPGEGLDEWVGKHQWIPPNSITARLGATNFLDQAVVTSFHNLLLKGKVDEVTRRRISFFSNTLVLPGFDGLVAAKIDDPKKLDNLKQTLSLRGRNLEGAIFDGADLRKADLFKTRLQGASLRQANLQRASLDQAELQGVLLNGANLQGASLDGANLQGASLNKTRLEFTSLLRAECQHASFNEAQLESAKFQYAQLQNASFDGANLSNAQLIGVQLQRASLYGAVLNATRLSGAQLQGARLDGAKLRASFGPMYTHGTLYNSAQLQGASLKDADLRGAELNGVGLQGATLDGAMLQGASFKPRAVTFGVPLESAQLQGASLRNARIQGVDFSNAMLAATDLSGAEIWRTSFEKVTMVAILDLGLKEHALFASELNMLDPTNMVPRNQNLHPDILGPEVSQAPMLAKARVDKATYQNVLADQLKNLACSGDENAPFVVRGLGDNGRLKDTGPFAPALIEEILSQKCPVSAALTEQDKANLRKLAKEALSHRLPAIIH